MKQYPFILASCLLVACSGSDPSVDSQPNPSIPQPSAEVTVKGAITAPDGLTPIGNATIFIPEDSLISLQSLNAPVTSIVKNSEPALDCPKPTQPYSVYSCTGADGSFALNLPSGQAYDVIVEKGAFKRILTIDVPTTSTQGTFIELESVALQEADVRGTTRIAVAAGYYDRIEDVLAKSGFGSVTTEGELELGTETFDLYALNDSFANTLPSSYPVADTLFETGPSGNLRIFDYDIVFLNCGTYMPTVDVDDPSIRSALREYVEAGGRLYVTDLSYDFIESAFPEFIDWRGSDTTPADAVETYGAPYQGIGGEIIPNAVVSNDSLRSFLKQSTCGEGSCLNDDGTVHIEGFLEYWTIMNGAHPGQTGVEFVVSGDAGESNGGVVPLTAIVPVGKGKILYSSYHTLHGYSAVLSPQERVLQWLVFE